MGQDMNNFDASEIEIVTQLHKCEYSRLFLVSIKDKQYAMKVVSIQGEIHD
jgi:hypothetical protein